MSTLKKILLVVSLAAIALAAIPAYSVFAAGLNNSNPAALSGKADPAWANLRLQWAFMREKNTTAQIGLALQNSDAAISLAQTTIDQAKTDGKDVSSAQAALDAFKAALKAAQPYYDQAKSAVDTHAGFDAQGNVTDAATAKDTVKGIADNLKQYKDAMGGTLKNLREAIRQLFQVNNPGSGQNSNS